MTASAPGAVPPARLAVPLGAKTEADTIEVNRVLAPVTALGPGRRLGLWVQGCSLRCPGCASRDTWLRGGGTTVAVTELAADLADRVEAGSLTGLTVTGGEPLDQAPALKRLIIEWRGRLAPPRSARAPRAERTPQPPKPQPPKPQRPKPEPPAPEGQLDVLLFTGYTASAAKRKAGTLWGELDAVVAGPYRRDLPSDEPLVASSNQELLRLDPAWEPGPGGRMQVMALDGELVMVGLPRPGDLDRLEASLRQRGVTFGGASWRS
ncbi:MAG: radical SAM protein [Bifidobacteriaceae bacterium]|jgi:anaerobic ribonucleoside-triphosphate reductase activating protein|nr:radical SAM protein [Bifidobacteriaceae bacterium]